MFREVWLLVSVVERRLRERGKQMKVVMSQGCPQRATKLH